MSASSREFDLSVPGEAPRSVQWWSWPLGDNLLKAIAVMGGVVSVGVLAGWVTGQTHLGALAGAVLVIALWRFFVPALFELNTNGVNRWIFGRHRRIPWQEIRSYQVYSNGVLLLPTAEPCPIDAFRGLYVPWGRHRGEVLAQVHYYLDRASAA